MKALKIWSLMIAVLFAASSCDSSDTPEAPAAGLEKIVNEWKLVEWGGAEAKFSVYIDFNEDGTYDMYQQVYDLSFEKFSGAYAISGDVVSGTYTNGDMWKSDYKVSLDAEGKVLTMISQEDVPVTGVYEATTIPEEVRAEGDATRAAEVVPFL